MLVTDRSFLSRGLLPTTRRDRTLTLLAGVCAGSIYLGRWFFSDDEVRMDAGLGLFFLVFPLAMLGMTSAVLLLIASIVHAGRGGFILPILLVVGGSALALQAPLPADTRVNPLAAHHADYTAVVDLARRHQLVADPTCRHGRIVPAAYRHLVRSCLVVSPSPSLALAFAPPTTHHLLLYAETEAALDTLIQCCLPKGSVTDRLEPMWYRFTPAQD